MGTQGRKSAAVIPEFAKRISGTQGPQPPALAGSPLFTLARYASASAGMTRRVCIAVAFLSFLVLLTPANAVQPDEILKDPALEARARHLSQELRCLVCQNQSIDDSNAELARDLRVIVRERLTAGDSDAAVLAFVEARYGEFVLLRPRLRPHTILLWLAPLLLLLGVAVVLLCRARARPASEAAAREATPLTSAEQRRLDELLASKDR
jgi:cytochrome c-type biogenesis protein CcmH